MTMDMGNFHAFFPKGCYRETITAKRKKIFAALDSTILGENFDVVAFEKAKQAYLNAMHSEKERKAFSRLNELIAPLFLLMLKQGFSKEELQNYRGMV